MGHDVKITHLLCVLLEKALSLFGINIIKTLNIRNYGFFN